MKIKEMFLKVFNKAFNWKMAVLALLFNGVVAGLANFGYGLSILVRAGLVQVLIAVIMAGTVSRIVQHLSRIKRPWFSYGLSFIFPLILRFVVTFIFHSLNHTPELWLTIILTVLVSAIASVGFNFGTRNLSHWRIFGTFFKIPGEEKRR
jgi:fructose-specific phosphotransferase system IIC component